MTVRTPILCCLFLLPAALCADPPKKAEPIEREELARLLADKIDARFEDFWMANQIVPAALADDGEYLRRLSLDLVGSIPTVQEVRQFIADRDKEKRAKVVARLQARSQHPVHLANVLRQQWLPQTLENAQFAREGDGFEKHLQEQLRTGVGYDRIVREMLTASTQYVDRRGMIALQNDEPAAAFNRVNEFNPANVAASTSRLFMGVKLECCQCHNHPFAAYKREQFWELAAFFAEVNPTIAAAGDAPSRRSIAIPEMNKTVSAKYLNGDEPKYRDDTSSPREVFADWLTAKENPYFARNAVNRVWQHFFGLGFIDPIDEPSEDNPSLIPVLHDELANAFADSGYDLRMLVNAVARSKVYQRSSRMTHASQSNPRQFARANVRGLTGEQIQASLVQATGIRDGFKGMNPFRNRGSLVAKFSSPEALIDRQTSILQALTLMNGNFLNGQTDLDSSLYLAGVVDAPFLSPSGKIESLFLATVSRMPAKDELKKYTDYVENAKGPDGTKKAFTDIYWALLNSSEFMLNH